MAVMARRHLVGKGDRETLRSMCFLLVAEWRANDWMPPATPAQINWCESAYRPSRLARPVGGAGSARVLADVAVVVHDDASSGRWERRRLDVHAARARERESTLDADVLVLPAGAQL